MSALPDIKVSQAARQQSLYSATEQQMGWRHTELAAFGPDVVPLSDTDAFAAYRRANECSSKTRYGLDETVFKQIDRLDVEEAGPEAKRWLAERLSGDVLLVYSGDAVFRVPASLFLDGWQDMFCPSRDDVMILPVEGGWALFYRHENEFEFAHGGPAEPKVAPDCGGIT